MKQNKNITPAEAIRDVLIKKKLTLAIAESVTCGHLQAAFGHIMDTGKFFQGGITAYNLGQKSLHLKIEPIEAEQHNCVSEKVAKQMALQVAELFFADVGISITGYATPMPEKGIDELFVYFALAKKGKILAVEKIIPTKTGALAVQKEYCQIVLEKVALLLKK